MTPELPSGDDGDAPGIRRREFLRGAAAVGGVAAVSGPSLVRSLGTRVARSTGSVLDHPASECPIDTVVVLMMENRSFDHFLGWLGSDEAYLAEGRRRWGRNFAVEAKNRLEYRDAAGAHIATEALVDQPDDPNPYRLCKGPIPGHGWFAGRRQRDHGFLAKGTGASENSIGYYTAADVPVHAALARRFTVCDHHFASLLGPTFPNRQYFHTGESEGRTTDPGPLRAGIFKSTTIWDRLAEANVTAGYYYTDSPASFLVYGDRVKSVIKNLDRYFEDCANGTLPNFVFIAPSFNGPYRTDHHPRGCLNVGERFILEVLGAFVQSAHWSHGMFALVYDEWGGFFDHVRPPVLADERASRIDGRNFGQAGFRVPATIASPYARQNYVDRRVYDHTSILRFLEWRFLGAPPEGPGAKHAKWFLTKRDRYALNYGRSLRPSGPEPDVDLTIPVRRPTPPCGNAIDLQLLYHDTDPFQVSDELKSVTDRLYPSPVLTPWLN